MNLERALAAAPDPILAHTAWDRVCESESARAVLERPAIAPVAIQVLALSSAAADFLVKYPEEAGLFATATARSRANLDAEVAADGEERGAAAGARPPPRPRTIPASRVDPRRGPRRRRRDARRGRARDHRYRRRMLVCGDR